MTIELAIWSMASDLCADVTVSDTWSQPRTCLATIDIPSDQECVLPASILRPQKVHLYEVASAVIRAQLTLHGPLGM